MNCFLCGVYTNTKTYPCRVCLRSFHDACLQKFGKLDPVSRALMVNQAETEEGWSCFNCVSLFYCLQSSIRGGSIKICRGCENVYGNPNIHILVHFYLFLLNLWVFFSTCFLQWGVPALPAPPSDHRLSIHSSYT